MVCWSPIWHCTIYQTLDQIGHHHPPSPFHTDLCVVPNSITVIAEIPVWQRWMYIKGM